VTELSVVALGHIHADDLQPLTPHFTRIEQLVLDIPPRSELTGQRAALHRAIDAASSDWILILREREVIDGPLADEIVQSIAAAKAWGFRIRAVPYYDGKPLRIGTSAEVRLLHRRHLLRRGDWNVQGTVVRLTNELRSITFQSATAHREQLAKSGSPVSWMRRILRFLRSARTLDANTLRYVWIEAGFVTPSPR